MKRWTTLDQLRINQRFVTKAGQSCVYLGVHPEDTTTHCVLTPDGFDVWPGNMRACVDVDDADRVAS